MAYKKKTEITKYHSDDPEKRARQLANLMQGRPDIKKKKEEERATLADVQKADIITFIENERFLNQKLYPAQRVLLKALYGLTLTKAETTLYKDLTGQEYKKEKRNEAVWCLGARSGKSYMAALIALYEATRPTWKRFLRLNESAYIVIIATKMQQAQQIIQRNAGAIIWNSPLQRLLESEPTSLEIVFKSGMRIISIPCNSTAGRGLPITTLIFDEVAFFFGEGFVKFDEDILNSLRPRQAQFGHHAKTILISTPSAKQGLFWDWFSEGNCPGRLTVQAATWKINPKIKQSFYDKEKQRDPDNFEREYEALFAEKTSAFFQEIYINSALILPGDIDPVKGINYIAAVDFSGLTGRDLTGFSIAHKTGQKVITDISRSWDSTNQDFIVSEIEKFVKLYYINTILLDRYGAGWTENAMKKIGLFPIIRESLPVIYSNLKSLMIAGLVEIPDKPDLRKALRTVRAFYGRNNSLSIQHERTTAGHGDECDAVATAVFGASKLHKYKQDEEPEYIVKFDMMAGVYYERNPRYKKNNFLNFKVEKF